MNLEEIFDNVYTKQSSKYGIQKSQQSIIEARQVFDDNIGMEGMLPTGPQEEFILQTQIRQYFQKEGINTTPIGTHPDFVGLESTSERINRYSCTMFVDIKGSTRLSLLYDLDTVFSFKNAVIQTCIEVVRAFDGYVHRIMGDAVMSFFGSADKAQENSIADAINCATTLKILLEQGITPWMEKNGLDPKDFGFRVGIDFGNDDEVIWGNFGYTTVGEVSATGLSVDMSSKLQSRASKNSTMLGQGLLDFVNWPDYFSHYKKIEVDGIKQPQKYLTPNITYTDNSPLNYRMKELSFDRFIEISALPNSVRSKVSANVRTNHAIDFKCFIEEDNGKKEYISASKFLDKGLNLLFNVSALTSARLKFPLTVNLIKTNYGQDVPEAEEGVASAKKALYINIPRQAPYSRTIPPSITVSEPEFTSYRGLHTMQCKVIDKDGALIFSDCIGVMIK
ncbi:hypothetical protein BCU70_08715 [Vibrio sp. 10N.286.49.C2]|uniref:nucleotide-binding domain-containing protein n=1 Tax=unclassified Vibrio TaxID=2614977 RepID=UPI000C8444D2|nr:MULTISPECIES: adenylate/guanylate cyclase domain-containing protein [unclassified Vibrio]PMH27658.1 hypothetical protein BCU70_08715 [Vibrio sp. 10N.286.49.C2]PMH53085.1 hypothetical protein BCU66_14835 [Vibrio sp. 10N.286.49.B1]